MTTLDHNPDEIIAKVLGRYMAKRASVKVGMSRGVLVVDENVAFLQAALREANFRVKTPKPGMSDDAIKEELLEHRVLVTKNTQDFVDDAPVYEYGIIGLEGLPIEASSTYKDNSTAKLIAKAFKDFKLRSYQSTGFVLMLRADGKHVFRKLQ